MNAIQLLREQFNSAHFTQDATMADVTDASAHFNDLSKALPVGAAYAHSVIGEDVVLSMMLAHKTPLSSDTSKTGLSEPMPSQAEWDKHEQWAKSVKVDLVKLKAFAQDVYKATDAYLAGLKDEDLEKEFDLSSMGMGKQTVVFVINNFLLLHTANLTGEISAVKGVQGLKGYPF